MSRFAPQPRPAESAPGPVPWWAVLAAVSFLCAWAFFVRYRFLAASPYPLGIDGYYYPVQVRAIFETGTLHYPSAPLALYLLAPLAAVFGPVEGAKVGAALASALLVLPVYALGRRIGESAGAGVLAAALVATSPSSFYMCTEFVKNAAGLLAAAAALWLLARALEAPTRKRAWVAAAGFAATLLTHKLAFALLLVFSLAPLARAARALTPAVRRRSVFAAALFAAALVVAGLLAPARFAGAADLAMVFDLLRFRPDFTLPVLDAGGGALHFRHEVWLAAALALGVIGTRFFPAHEPSPARGKRGVEGIAWGAALVVLLGAAPWLDVTDPQGPGFRLRLCLFLGAALCAPRVAAAVTARVPRRARALVLFAAAALCLLRPARYEPPVIRAHPAMVEAVRNLKGRVPPGGVVIVPERHILFMVAWYTRTPARLRPEPVAREKRWRLLPLAFLSEDLRRALETASAPSSSLPGPIPLHPLHPQGLLLVPEVTWEAVLETLPPGPRAHYRRWPVI